MPMSQKFGEIERKFLVQELPERLRQYQRMSIAQGYLAVDKDGTEIRIRKISRNCFITVKVGSGRVRREWQTEISIQQFKKLWPATYGKRIEKVRYNIPYKQWILELDIYRGHLKGLICAEVEFTSREQSRRFKPPQWFGKEVTEDERYKNKNLALFGLRNLQRKI